MTYRTILFDFDGTLTPSLELWVEAYQYALSCCGLALTDEDIIERCFYRSYADVTARLGIPPEHEFTRLMEAGLLQAFGKARLFPAARELLDSCKQAGFALGLVTSSAADLIAHALPHLGLVDYFDTVVTGSDVTNYKPHPEPVRLALERLGKSPEETLFVGDTWMDMQAGRAAGTHIALFTTEDQARYNEPDRLLTFHPEFIFSHHEELMRYLMPQAAGEMH